MPATPSRLNQYQALLDVLEAMTRYSGLRVLLRTLAEQLLRIVPVNFVGVALYDPEHNLMRTHMLEANLPVEIIGGHEDPLPATPAGLVWETQQPLLVPDLAAELRWPRVIRLMQADGVQSCCVLPLTSAVRKLGVLVFASVEKAAYAETNLEFMRHVARLVAVAVDNALHHESAEAAQRDLVRERDRLRFLLDLNNAVVSQLELRNLFAAVAVCVRRAVPHDATSLALFDEDRRGLRVYALDGLDGRGELNERLHMSLDSPAGRAVAAGQPLVFQAAELARFPSDLAARFASDGIRSACCVPLVSARGALGALTIARCDDGAFRPEDVELLASVAGQISIAVDNALTHEEVRILKDQLAKDKLYLEEEIQTSGDFKAIVGESQAVKRVLQEAHRVAATDATVLILGETGSGKELIARAIHDLSDRRDRMFVKMNCAAIPTGLLESELFGHEKGAFTGAIATKLGRFELADHGTIFLDEVGEIPLELQVKLLRVLQERDFERLGSTRTRHVDVRVVAATNHDLERMVEAHAFRSDLYYRLNVFPITVPPLRDRAEDIPLLVRHFVEKFARRMKKGIQTIPTETMRVLQQYGWPGNIRELEHVIERAVILSTGSDLRVPLEGLNRPRLAAHSTNATLDEAELTHILKVLRDTHWVVGGHSGAATRLGMKRTTLLSKMKKLGISRPS